MKALWIGLDNPDLGEDSEIEIVEQLNVTWPATSEMVAVVLWTELFPKADKLGACLLFQDTPGQLVAALMLAFGPESVLWQVTAKLVSGVRPGKVGYVRVPRMGVVVSVPGEQPEEITTEFALYAADLFDSATAVEAIRVVNPNAKVTVEGFVLTVTVASPTKFEFSHIEWLNE